MHQNDDEEDQDHHQGDHPPDRPQTQVEGTEPGDLALDLLYLPGEPAQFAEVILDGILHGVKLVEMSATCEARVWGDVRCRTDGPLDPLRHARCQLLACSRIGMDLGPLAEGIAGIERELCHPTTISSTRTPAGTARHVVTIGMPNGGRAWDSSHPERDEHAAAACAVGSTRVDLEPAVDGEGAGESAPGLRPAEASSTKALEARTPAFDVLVDRVAFGMSSMDGERASAAQPMQEATGSG